MKLGPALQKQHCSFYQVNGWWFPIKNVGNQCGSTMILFNLKALGISIAMLRSQVSKPFNSCGRGVIHNWAVAKSFGWPRLVPLSWSISDHGNSPTGQTWQNHHLADPQLLNCSTKKAHVFAEPRPHLSLPQWPFFALVTSDASLVNATINPHLPAVKQGGRLGWSFPTSWRSNIDAQLLPRGPRCNGKEPQLRHWLFYTVILVQELHVFN